MNIQTIDIQKLQISPFNVRKLSNELLNELKSINSYNLFT